MDWKVQAHTNSAGGLYQKSIHDKTEMAGGMQGWL